MGYQETKAEENRGERFPGQTAGTADLHVFNKEYLLDNVGGDRILMGYLVSVFIDDFGSWEKLFEKALTSGDAGTLQRLAHKTKGTAANVGAEVISALLADIEDKVSRKDLPGVIVVFQDLRGEFKRFERFFDTSRQA